MCGLFGVLNRKQSVDRARATSCLDGLSHRGPDGRGEWCEGGVYIGHRRLSILDLTDSGSQPMWNDRAVITVNGEIYNFEVLRKELQPLCEFHSHSDSEVVLHGYCLWGLEELCRRLEGMYAIAIFDRHTNELHIIRDRFGVKPLYYFATKDGLGWASELQPLADFMGLSERDYSAEAMLDFVTYRYIPAPKSLYTQIHKLPAAHRLTYQMSSGRWTIQQYWDLSFTTQTVSWEQALQNIETLLSQSVVQQVVSDAPVGAFLSGGIDSGLVMSAAVKAGLELPTFSIGFAGQEDETEGIVSTVSRLGLTNDLTRIDGDFAAQAFQEIRRWYGEPFADFSFVPTYAVCQRASETTKVCLSGDGADELFGGYGRYQIMARAGSALFGNKISRDLIGSVKNQLGWSLAGRLLRWIELKGGVDGERLYCVLNGGILPEESRQYARCLEVADDYDRLWLYKKRHQRSEFMGDDTHQWRYLDMITSLPDMLLAKVDRLSMRCSLEVRVPWLTTEMAELAFSIPDCWHFENDGGKALLKTVARGRLTNEVVDGPKRGFGIPLDFRLSREGRRCSPQKKVLSEFFDEIVAAQFLK